MVANSKSTVQDTTTPVGEWGGEQIETLGGMEVVEKALLLGVTHLITGYKFTYNETRKISYVWCEFETTPGGDRKTYNDASASGVRFQMETFHDAKNPGQPFELDKWYDTRLLVPQGLRDSEFETKNERNQKITGRAFYLTLVNTGRQ